MKRTLCAAGAALVLAACTTSEKSTFTPTAGQDAIVRDGIPALLSTKANSVVLVRQVSRERRVGSRPSYVIGILNLSPQPVNFAFSNLEVAQLKDGTPKRLLKTYSYEHLVKEEKTKQVLGAILLGVAAGANTYSASQSGRYTATGTVVGPYGTSHVSISGYDPTANQLAQMNANAQNQAMISNAVEAGRRSLDSLETTIIKDNTIFPGEWYGGQLQFERPENGETAYRLSVRVGNDVHFVDVASERGS